MEKANVTAIYKKGERTDASNYGPISLTCILCKVLESIVKDTLVTYLESNNMIVDCQHGFRNNRSCISQLLHVMEDFTKMIDDKKDIVYFDFSKAFDSVPHEKL